MQVIEGAHTTTVKCATQYLVVILSGEGLEDGVQLASFCIRPIHDPFGPIQHHLVGRVVCRCMDTSALQTPGTGCDTILTWKPFERSVPCWCAGYALAPSGSMNTAGSRRRSKTHSCEGRCRHGRGCEEGHGGRDCTSNCVGAQQRHADLDLGWALEMGCHRPVR